MDNRELFAYVDHSILKPNISWEDINMAAREATVYGAATLCIPPNYVSRVHQHYHGLPISTVVGFPMGYSTTGAKVFEAQTAIANGAREIDLVIANSDVRDKRLHRVMAEIVSVRNAIEDAVLKVILETCYLKKGEIVEIAKIAEAAGADYVKTSTGFGTGGAKVEDVELLRRNLGDQIKIKASGGICDKQQMEDLINAGASRLGSSRAVQVLFKQKA